MKNLIHRWKLRRDLLLPLPEGSVQVVTIDVQEALPQELIGSFMDVGIGTMGAARVLNHLQILATSRLGDVLGSALIVEHDSNELKKIQSRVPAEFQDGRVVYATSRAYSGGFSNKPFDWTLEHTGEWGLPLHEGTQELIDVQLRRNADRVPSLVVFNQSLGGSAPCSVPVLADIYQAFGDRTFVLGTTALPRHARLRQRWTDVKTRLADYGCTVWDVTDNLVPDAVTANAAFTIFLHAATDAALTADHPTAPNNLLALASRKAAGTVLVHQVVSETVTAYPFAGNRLFVYRDSLNVAALNVVRKLARDEGQWSADVPRASARDEVSTFDFLVTPLRRDDILRLHDDISASLALEAQYKTASTNGSHPAPSTASANYELAFSRLPVTFPDPLKARCPVLGIRLAAVRDDVTADDIVQIPGERRLAQLPPPSAQTS